MLVELLVLQMCGKLCSRFIKIVNIQVFFNYYLGTFFATMEVVMWKELLKGGCVGLVVRR